MNEVAIFTLINFFLCLFLGHFAFFKNPKKKLNLLYLLFSVSYAYSILIDFNMLTAKDINVAEFWAKIHMLGILPGAFYLHFILIFTEQRDLLKNKLIYIILYIPVIIFFLIDYFTGTIRDEVIPGEWGWRIPLPTSVLGLVIDIWSYVIGVLSLVLIVRFYLRVKEHYKKKQAGIIILGFVIPVVFCVGLILTNYMDITVPNIPITVFTLQCIFIGYALLKYKLSPLIPEVIARDITDSKRYEKEYKDLENKLKSSTRRLEREKSKAKAMLLAIGDGLIVTDKKGNIVLVNKTFEENIGWTEDEALGKSILEVVRVEDRKGRKIPDQKRMRVFNHISSKKETPSKTPFYSTTDTYYYVRKDKSRFPVTVTSTPIIIESEIVGAIEVFRDVTKEKEIDRTKSEFVSLASHQLRNPLTSICWYIEVLLSKKIGRLNKEQKEHLDWIYRGSKRMTYLVNALLNVSRIELGIFVINPKETDIQKLTDNVIKESELQIKEKKLQIVRDYAKDVKNINVDPNLMRIVFQNLISNAVKYTPNKGTVSVSVQKEKSDVVIKVSDTGYGIPKDQQEKIFTKLFRADNVKEKQTEGSGIGLYVTKSIIERAGGEISFISELNKGTTFIIRLPSAGMKRIKGTRELTIL